VRLNAIQQCNVFGSYDGPMRSFDAFKLFSLPVWANVG